MKMGFVTKAPLLFASVLFGLSFAKPISVFSPVGLENFLLPHACEDACTDQWADVAVFHNVQDCMEQLCTPITQHLALVDTDVIDVSGLPSLHDILLNCAEKCDAEWWLDGLNFESSEHCYSIVCSFPDALRESLSKKLLDIENEKDQRNVNTPEEEKRAKADIISEEKGHKDLSESSGVEMLRDASKVTPQDIEEEVPVARCFRHADCDSDKFCGKHNECLHIRLCSLKDEKIDSNEAIDGICPENKKSPEGKDINLENTRVIKVSVFSGLYIDQIKFTFSNGTTVSFGASGGAEQKSFEIPDGEWLTWIKVWQGGFLDSIQFFTNRGTASARYGGEGGRKKIFHIEKGNELWGIVRNDGNVAAPVEDIIQRPHIPYLKTSAI